MMHSRDEDILKEIALKRSRWIDAINSGSADEFVSVLMDDAVWLPLGQSAIEGKENVRAWIRKPFSEYEFDYEVNQIGARIVGEWAVETARFRTEAVDSDGVKAPTHDGVYTILWRRVDIEGWLIDRYVDLTELDAT